MKLGEESKSLEASTVSFVAAMNNLGAAFFSFITLEPFLDSNEVFQPSPAVSQNPNEEKLPPPSSLVKLARSLVEPSPSPEEAVNPNFERRDGSVSPSSSCTFFAPKPINYRNRLAILKLLEKNDCRGELEFPPHTP